jgi:hypothetical protein
VCVCLTWPGSVQTNSSLAISGSSCAGIEMAPARKPSHWDYLTESSEEDDDESSEGSVAEGAVSSALSPVAITKTTGSDPDCVSTTPASSSRSSRSRSKSRSRSRSPPRSATPVASQTKAVKFKLVRGTEWWSVPLARALMASRCKDRIRVAPARPLVHVSACSGMMTELIPAEVGRVANTDSGIVVRGRVCNL